MGASRLWGRAQLESGSETDWDPKQGETIRALLDSNNLHVEMSVERSELFGVEATLISLLFCCFVQHYVLLHVFSLLQRCIGGVLCSRSLCRDREQLRRRGTLRDDTTNGCVGDYKCIV